MMRTASTRLSTAAGRCARRLWCGPTAAAPVEGLETFVVQAGDAGSGRAWDGVVEAVLQATLAAQTAARVAEVPRDVGDHVQAGELLVRLSAVEQQAGADAARAALRAAEATAAEAESDYRRYQALAASVIARAG